MPEPAHSAQPLIAGDSGAPCLATIESAADGDRAVVAVRGELDIGAARLGSTLHAVLGRSVTGIDLDLSGVGFCDCGGLNLLLDLRRRALVESKTVTVRDCSAVVERVLDLTGTRELFVSPEAGGPPVDPAAVPDARGREVVDQELRAEVAQLRRAMQTRPAIDVARGILMATFGLGPEAAWTVLVTASQNTNTKLHHLARDLVGTVDGGPLAEAVQRQMALAVAKVRDGSPEPSGPVVVREATSESQDMPPCA